jgi:chromate transporter
MGTYKYYKFLTLHIFFVFLLLGFTAFGGPVAHIGYFRSEFVDKRKWVDANQFQDLVALCQFLPGPMSSQVGFGLGMLRGNIPGGLAAWLGFTAPSAIFMLCIGIGINHFNNELVIPFLHGLKLAAVAIITWALWQMGKSALRGKTELILAIGSCTILLCTNLLWIQVALIILSAFVGIFCIPRKNNETLTSTNIKLSKRFGNICVFIFIGILLGAPVIAAIANIGEIYIFSSFFRVGSFVFGGGHVVLPLLQSEVVPLGWVNEDKFLAGYGAVQAMPGPLFTFASYLGAVSAPIIGNTNGWIVGLIALFAIFLPSFFILCAALPYWTILRSNPSLRSAIKAVNATVVGVLLAVFIDPVITSSVNQISDICIVFIGIFLLALKRIPVWLIVLLSASTGAFL